MGWTSPALIAAYLGATVDPDDPYLVSCAAAADAFCFNRRREAGYVDDPDTAPNPAVELGATYYGGTLYRERGSADGFASFDETSAFATVGSWSRIKQLLGVGRGQVDRPEVVLEPTPYRRRLL